MSRHDYIFQCMQLDEKRFSLFKRWSNKVIFSDEVKCWDWVAFRDNQGYGRMSSFRGKSPFKAHRLSLSFISGEMKEFGALHKCDNPSCVNPNHLYWGTQKQNMRDASKRKRLNPKSFLNLRPGEKGVYGAGSKSKGDIINEQSK